MMEDVGDERVINMTGKSTDCEKDIWHALVYSTCSSIATERIIRLAKAASVSEYGKVT